MKRAISMLLLSAMLVSAFACSEKSGVNNGPSDTSVSDNGPAAEDETEISDEPELPEYDGENKSFTFIYPSDMQDYNEVHIEVEQMDGEIVNDAVYTRNRETEEKLNIKIVGVPSSSAADDLATAVIANDAAYDAAWDEKVAFASYSTKGYLTDYNKIPYINVDTPYWDANAAAELSFAGKLFFMPCDISMMNFTGARFLYFNRKLVTDYNLTDPYDIIFGGAWTLDTVLSMISAVSADLNGDGKMTGEDQFGLLAEEGGMNGNVIYFLTAAGVRYTEKNSDDIPEITFNNERTIKVMEMCAEVLKDKNVAITYEDASAGMDTSGYMHYFDYCRRALFANDHFLFVQNGVEETSAMKDMKSDYGFAPNPKLEETQENYYHAVDIFTSIMTIPATVSDYDSEGIILEYLAWKSPKTLLPAFYDITIKTKRSRDERDAIVCDMVKSSIRYEISNLFNIGISDILWNAYKSGNYASKIDKSMAGINKKIDRMVASISEMD